MGQSPITLRPAGDRWRTVLVAAVVIASLSAASAVAYRVLRARRGRSPGRPGTIPDEAADGAAGVIGTLAAAPLIVDGRLRVYAATRQIRADAPVDARTQRSPFWSYRRWPAQLIGVVAVGYDGGRPVERRHAGGAGRAYGTGGAGRRRAGARRSLSTPGGGPGRPPFTPRKGCSSVGGSGDRAERRPIWTPPRSSASTLASGRRLWRLSHRRRSRLPAWPTSPRRAGGTRSWISAPTLGRGRSGSTTSATGELDLAWRLPAGAAGKILSGEPLGCRVGRSDCAAMSSGHRRSGAGLAAARADAGARAWSGHRVPRRECHPPEIADEPGHGRRDSAAGAGADAGRG